MILDIVNNKYALLNIKHKYGFFIITFLLVLIFLFSLAIILKTYDVFKYTGICEDNKINITTLSNDINNIITSEYLEINGKSFEFSIESVSEMEFEQLTNSSYQTIIISTSTKLIENESFEITFYKNKQRIITKVFNLLK